MRRVEDRPKPAGPERPVGRHRLVGRRGLARVVLGPHLGRVRQAFRVLGLATLILLVPAGWSYANALRAPGSAPFGARTVEWVSDHGGGTLVIWAEHVWYTWHKPPVGGAPPPGAFSQAPSSPRPVRAQARSVFPHLPRPRDIRPFVRHPMKNEGVWMPVGRWAGHYPTMYEALLRPDSVHTSLVAGVVWMDPKLLRAVLVPGTQEPGGTGWKWQGEVPAGARAGLAAAFNSGFRMKDARGGWYTGGRTQVPLVDGAASLVIYKDGTATVGKWGRDVRMTPQVQSVRQNLSLIVDNGRPTPQLKSGSFRVWGATLGNQVLVWRSGVGVTADGALVYAAGPGLSIDSLASVLVRAGAVRAMELDINTDWVTFNFYGSDRHSPFGVSSAKLLPNMIRPSSRYLVLDERDFIAMFVRSKASLRASGTPAHATTSGR